jgi:hypothetical protein
MICREITVEVARKEMEQKVAGKPVVPELLGEIVDSRMWVPAYAKYARGAEHVE